MKIEQGEIFYLQSKTGKIYLRFIKPAKTVQELDIVEVFYKIHGTDNDVNSEEIINGGSFYLRFPGISALRKKIIKHFSYKETNEEFMIPTLFRTENPFGDGWNIIDAKKDKYIEIGLLKLTPEQLKLSPWPVWNDTILIENLEAGWRLENWK